MYEHFRAAVGPDLIGISRRDLVAMDQALTYVEGLVATQGAEDRFQALDARVDVLCAQLDIVNRILQALLER